jgi:ribonuclease H2 subunit C
MLAIQTPSKSQRCTPNLLPARLNYNGPISSAEQYWKPETDSKNAKHAYFRGRHLHGTTLPLPSNYAGAVLNITEKDLPQQTHDDRGVDAEDDDEMEDEKAPEVKVAEKLGEFDEVLVWGHGGTVDEQNDEYARAIGEWVGFAEAIHCDEDEVEREQEKDKKTT